LLPEANKHRASEAQKTSVLTVFFCSESVKRRKSTTYVAIFWGQKNAKIRCVVTTTTTNNKQQQQQTEAQNATKSLLQAAV